MSAAAAAVLFTCAASGCKSETGERRPETPMPPIMRIERTADEFLPPRGFPPRGPHGPNENGADDGKNRPPKVTPPEKKMIFVLLPRISTNGGAEETPEETLPSEQTAVYSR